MDEESVASMMVPGMGEDFTWDLVGVAVTEGAGQEVDWANREGSQALPECGGRAGTLGVDGNRTADEPDHFCQPRGGNSVRSPCSIRNPMREPIITASEWDPVPGESEEESPVAGDGKRLCSILCGNHKALAVEPKQQDVAPNFRTPARRITGTTFEQL